VLTVDATAQREALVEQVVAWLDQALTEEV
jgi:hypothetical protein